jgi:pimeloyl-ACP methyl ester carboxylesterase
MAMLLLGLAVATGRPAAVPPQPEIDCGKLAPPNGNAGASITGTSGPLAQAPGTMSSRDVLVHGHHLAFHIMPGRLPVLVLDAGSGADSTYWNSIIPELAKRTGSKIITYDRAGFGASDEVPPPFRMEDAVTDLESGLRRLGATRDLVLISHSFAGSIATYLAIRHRNWISGAVLVDTNVPEFFTDEEVAHLAPLMQPMVAAELAAHSDRKTRTLEAITEAYVETSHDFHKAIWPASIPCEVIVSEGTPFPPEMKLDIKKWKDAHAAFANKACNGQLIVASSSSHDIAHDRPEVIIETTVKLVDRLRSAKRK